MRYDDDIRWWEITDRDDYLDRRRFLKRGAQLAGGLGAAVILASCEESGVAGGAATAPPNPDRYASVAKGPFSTDEPLTTYHEATNYNNFWEFGPSKIDPARRSVDFVSRPWTLTIDGLVGRPMTVDVDDLIRRYDLEERIYRLRCVEAWSMVIPWIGLPLANLLRDVEPTADARYVRFETFFDRDTFPRRARSIAYPYIEGLRLDEAMNPLPLLAVGMYGDHVANPNGPPIRLVVPWKYGFKSGKSIARISLVDREPRTAWSRAAPQEYGFYSNVNPARAHPRWSQASERRIGQRGRIETQLFNGYGEHVAHLYDGMDLINTFY